MIFQYDLLRQLRRNQGWEYHRVWGCADNPEQHGLAAVFPLPGTEGLEEQQALELAKRLGLPQQGDESLLRVWNVDTRH